METYSPNEGVRPEIPKEGIGSSCLKSWLDLEKDAIITAGPKDMKTFFNKLDRQKSMSLEEVNEAIESLRKEQVDLQKRISKLYELKWKHERLDELCEVDLLLDRSSPL